MPTNKVCCLAWCINNSRNTRAVDAKYFTVPQSLNTAQKWRDWIAKENYPVVKNLKNPALCMEHFPKKQILPNNKLVPGTVPSIGKKIPSACVNVERSEPTTISLTQLLQESATVPSYSMNSAHAKCHEVATEEGEHDSFVLNKESCVEEAGILGMTSPTPMEICSSSPTRCPPVCTVAVVGTTEPQQTITTTGTSGSVSAEGMQTPKSTVRHRSKRCVGELSPSDFKSPKSVVRNLNIVKQSHVMMKKKLKIERNKLYRLKQKVRNLEELVEHLQKDKKLIQEEAAMELQSVLPGAGAKIFERAKNHQGALCPELREFALTLHFYSTAAYNYVRRVFMKCLPHERTLVKWYVHVHADPGFTKCSVEAIKQKAAEMKKKNQKLVLALSMDEMHIKTKIERVNEKVYGYPDLGFGEVKDNSPPATKALVFMATAMNASWKVPVGYFFLNSLNGQQRSVLMKDCLNLLLETQAEIASLTFDGDSANLAAASSLGASFKPFTDWRPYIEIKRPSVNHRIEIILDACHMIKLVRNVMGDPQAEIIDSNGHKIEWKYLERLNEFQVEEGLHAANRITSRHVRFVNEKQKVKLAVQLLSRSVALALNLLEFQLNVLQFSGAKATADFILLMNDLFDVLNSRSMYAVGLKGALSPRNIQDVLRFLDVAEIRIRSFKARVYETRSSKWSEPELILNTRKKTGFLGLLMCISAVRSMYSRLVEQKVLLFIGTFKTSQDHIETFFSAVRSRGGWRNNPSAREFMSAYKRLLVHVELSPNKKGNCWPIELTTILTVPSTTRTSEASEVGGGPSNEIDISDPDEVVDFRALRLSSFVLDVVGHIAGFVSRSVFRTVHCPSCCEALFGDESASTLTVLRNQGGLLDPSRDVVTICRLVETEVRLLKVQNKVITASLPKVQVAVKRALLSASVFKTLDSHVFEQDIMYNHKDLLVNCIIKKYFSLRINFEGKQLTEAVTGDRIRSRNNKLVLFKNQ